jgi:hypothetical protein
MYSTSVTKNILGKLNENFLLLLLETFPKIFLDQSYSLLFHAVKHMEINNVHTRDVCLPIHHRELFAERIARLLPPPPSTTYFLTNNNARKKIVHRHPKYNRYNNIGILY